MPKPLLKLTHYGSRRLAEFPPVCMVLSTKGAKGMIEYLETGAQASMTEVRVSDKTSTVGMR